MPQRTQQGLEGADQIACSSEAGDWFGGQWSAATPGGDTAGAGAQAALLGRPLIGPVVLRSAPARAR